MANAGKSKAAKIKPPCARVELTYTDLVFLWESIGQNIPSTDDMTPDELSTYNKIVGAMVRVRKAETA